MPGDVVILAAGDLVPADARLIESRDLYLDEALLTGEPYPAEKDAAPPTGASSGSAFPPDLVFMGSSVVSGTAKALVVSTGRKAQLGSIASALQKPPPPTAHANTFAFNVFLGGPKRRLFALFIAIEHSSLQCVSRS